MSNCLIVIKTENCFNKVNMWGECVDIYGYIQYKYGTYKLEPLYYFQYESPATCQIIFFCFKPSAVIEYIPNLYHLFAKKAPDFSKFTFQ